MLLLGQIVFAGKRDGELARRDPPPEVGLDLLPEGDTGAGVGESRSTSRSASRCHPHLTCAAFRHPVAAAESRGARLAADGTITSTMSVQ